MVHAYPEGCVFATLDDIKDKKITVMGLGLNGGGEACVRFFLQHGAFVTVTDMKTKEQLQTTIDSLENDKELDTSRLTYVLGEHREEDFSNADCVIKNPGVKYEGNKYLALARAIETDLSIFLHFTRSPIIAVTGSKGKSSTVSALHFILNECGKKSFLGGNITVSPLTFLDKTTAETPVVLELSSWQLADLRGRKALKPKVAIITKIVPDHQNWYGNMESYVNDKKLIYADQTKDDYTILDMDKDDSLETSWGDVFAGETKGTVLRYSSKELPEGVYGAYRTKDEGFISLPEIKTVVMGKLLVPGEHMRINVLNAALAAYLMGLPIDSIKKATERFTGIAHRLEQCHTWKNAVFFNDSCATVPQATVAAAQAFDTPTVLIAGGTDKVLDFAPLADFLAGDSQKKPAMLYLLAGTGTAKLTALLDEKKVTYNGPYDSLKELLGDVKGTLEKLNDDKAVPVVFSPGATSFGMFKNEFDRGNTYKALVKELFV